MTVDLVGETLDHKHESCGDRERVWLPYEVREARIKLKKHPYCLECGSVKNIGPDRPKKLGYYFNALTMMKRDLGKRITEPTARLIRMELSSIKDFEDGFSMTKWAQEKAFVEVMRKYTRVDEETTRSYL